MKKLIVSGLAAVGFAGCLLTPCPAIDCADAITISVKDAAGQPLSSFSGSATIQGRQIGIDCGGADAGLPDGGVATFDEQAGCQNGAFSIFGGTGSELSVELHAGNLSFSGPVEVKMQTNAVADARCNASCTSGTGSVTLK